MQVGEILRSRREALGLTLEEVHQHLRIPVRSLQAIEDGHFDVFDSPQYAKGFVRSYATLLGLDPEPLVQAVGSAYPARRAPQLVAPGGEVPIRPVAPPSRFRRLAAWVALAAVVGLLWLGYVGYRQLRAFYSAPQPPESQPPPVEVSPAPTQAGPPRADRALPPPALAGESAVRLALTAEDVSWLRVVADGRRVFEGFLRAGERREWEAGSSLQVVIGNAGGVRVQVNGQDLGILGAPGEVVRRTFTSRTR